MSSRLKSRLAGAATVAASVLLALAVSDGIARLLLDPPRYHREPVALDSELGFRGIPNHVYRMRSREGGHEVALNRDGLRGRALPEAPAPEGVQRIAFLGDSFLVGEAVPEAALLTTRVEAELRERGVAVEVYNLSAADWGTGQQLLYFEQVAEALAPDTVVLALYPANDVVNNSMHLSQATTTSPGDPIRPYLIFSETGRSLAYRHPTRAWLRRHSRIFALLENRLRPPGAGEQPPVSRPERLRAGRLPLEELEIFSEHPEGHRWSLAWQDSFALLRALKTRCDALQARLLVLVIPSVHQVRQTAESVRFGVEARAFARRPLSTLVDWKLPEQKLLDFFQEAEIEAVLLLDALRAAVRDSGAVYARDGHLDAHGHAVAAAAVTRALVDGAQSPWPPRARPLWPVAPRGSRLLDFTQAPHDERLGAGWLVWEAGGAGWRVGPAAMVALEPDTGPIALRGRLADDAPLPLTIALQVVGGKVEKQVVERAGPFALEFPFAGESARSESGHIAVVIAAGRVGALQIEAVGFDPGRDS